jgi:hypothetical protein
MNAGGRGRVPPSPVSNSAPSGGSTLMTLAGSCCGRSLQQEAWTFREADVRLAEHRELRAALGLPGVPDCTTRYRFLGRLHETVLEQALSAVVQWLLPQPGGQATVAVDATGLTPGAISTFFVKRAKDREPGFP